MSVFIENPRRGGGGARGPGGCPQGIGGVVGLNIFWGPKCPPRLAFCFFIAL